MVDPKRDVLWACAVDLSPESPPTPSRTGASPDPWRRGHCWRSYTMPDGGLCADIALARGDVYVTYFLCGRIVRLTGTKPGIAEGERLPCGRTTLTASVDEESSFLLDQRHRIRRRFRTFYNRPTTAPASCSPSGIGTGGSAEPADRDPDTPDDQTSTGLRWRNGYLYVADNMSGLITHRPGRGNLDRDRRPARPAVIARVRERTDIWITEGQVTPVPDRRAAQPALRRSSCAASTLHPPRSHAYYRCSRTEATLATTAARTGPVAPPLSELAGFLATHAQRGRQLLL